jgi:hypothetical protein
MAKVKIEDVVDHLSSEFRRALEETMKEHFPNQSFDTHNVFRTFKRQVSRKCNTWESVPEQYVEK